MSLTLGRKPEDEMTAVSRALLPSAPCEAGANQRGRCGVRILPKTARGAGFGDVASSRLFPNVFARGSLSPALPGGAHICAPCV